MCFRPLVFLLKQINRNGMYKKRKKKELKRGTKDSILRRDSKYEFRQSGDH
jgi:hypothetical protein